MIDFILSILSSVLQMNMRDHHDIPFALPLVMAATAGLTIGFIFLSMLTREEKQREQQINSDEQR